LVLAAVLIAAVACSSLLRRTDAPLSSAPPPAGGYFQTVAVGGWRSLPSDAVCAAQVHRSSWEPRALNAGANATTPDPNAVHEAFATRSRSATGGFKPRWDSWLLPRVDGAFTGTTDEIFQWAACKWGLADNVLRAIAVRESTWYQDPTYLSGRCVVNWGCGDIVASATKATRRFCEGLRLSGGYDYEADFGRGICPETFSIAGVKSWENPTWGRFADNQNGTFPFNRDSTAFAVDYLASQLRGCFEGWEPWLANTGPYRRGELWGCVGAWYAGAWRTPPARQYVRRVRQALSTAVWLTPSFVTTLPPCDDVFGCPVSGVRERL
jgi:hypothetical protein